MHADLGVLDTSQSTVQCTGITSLLFCTFVDLLEIVIAAIVVISLKNTLVLLACMH